MLYTIRMYTPSDGQYTLTVYADSLDSAKELARQHDYCQEIAEVWKSVEPDDPEERRRIAEETYRLLEKLAKARNHE